MSQTALFRNHPYLPEAAKIVRFESPDPLLALLEQTGCFGSFQFNFQTRVLEWSSEMFRRYGFEPTDQITTDDSMERVHPDDRQVVQEAIVKAVNNRTGYAMEYRVMRPDGEIFWLLTRGQIQWTSNGTPARILGIALDISKMKHAELEARAASERLQLAERAGGIGTWEWEFENGTLYWSDELRELVGISTNVSSGIENWLALIHEDDVSEVRESLDRLRVSCPEEPAWEYRMRRPDGRLMWVSARGRLHRNENGQPQRLLGVVVDVTERKRAEDALRKSEKLAATGRLAATISHEINNPLEAITNLLYLSLGDPELSDRVRGYLSDADGELKRVANLVRQTLGFYRESRMRRAANMSDLVQSVLELYRRRFETKHVRLITEFDLSLAAPIIESEIRQVVSNFVSNALDATEAGGGVIHARVSEAGKHAKIEIEDDGVGISEESRQHLFEAFFTTKRNTGTGLGLWISKEIAENHGGAITVESSTDSANHGTRFTLSVPLRIEE